MNRLASLTSQDFEVGQTIRHARGKTVTEPENVNITNMVMNTAQGHFNLDLMQKTPLGKILSHGGVNFSIVLGLAAQDTVENALSETGLDNIRLRTMVFHGDTLYAYSRVLEKRDSDREDAGELNGTVQGNAEGLMHPPAERHLPLLPSPAGVDGLGHGKGRKARSLRAVHLERDRRAQRP